jgi:hypothetical protein
VAGTDAQKRGLDVQPTTPLRAVLEKEQQIQRFVLGQPRDGGSEFLPQQFFTK